MFAGIDLIAESDAGRTFAAFWRLLTDPEQAATFDQALDHVMSRTFINDLEARERRFLLKLTRTLLEQGGTVHDVLQTFARSLKHFVQSREYLEQRRLNQLLSEAQRTALTIKDEIKATESLHYSLELTSSRITSLSQWVLYDPALQATPERMATGEAPLISLEALSDLIAQSEINFRALKANVLALLEQQAQASISEILNRFPATQGLGSVVGLLALASKHGLKGEHSETVSWLGGDNQQRRARIPQMFFLREKAHELV